MNRCTCETSLKANRIQFSLTFKYFYATPPPLLHRARCGRKTGKKCISVRTRHAPSSRDSPGTGPADSARTTLWESENHPPAHSLSATHTGLSSPPGRSETSVKSFAWWQSVDVMLVSVDNSYSLTPGAPIATSEQFRQE